MGVGRALEERQSLPNTQVRAFDEERQDLLGQMSQQRESLQQELEAVSAERAQLQAELATARQALSESRSLGETQQALVEELRRSNAQAKADLERLGELTRQEQEVGPPPFPPGGKKKGTKKDIDTQEIGRLRRALEAAQSDTREAELEQEAEEARARVRELERQLRESRAVSDELSDALSSATADIEALQAKVARVQDEANDRLMEDTAKVGRPAALRPLALAKGNRQSPPVSPPAASGGYGGAAGGGGGGRGPVLGGPARGRAGAAAAGGRAPRAAASGGRTSGRPAGEGERVPAHAAAPRGPRSQGKRRNPHSSLLPACPTCVSAQQAESQAAGLAQRVLQLEAESKARYLAEARAEALGRDLEAARAEVAASRDSTRALAEANEELATRITALLAGETPPLPASSSTARAAVVLDGAAGHRPHYIPSSTYSRPASAGPAGGRSSGESGGARFLEAAAGASRPPSAPHVRSQGTSPLPLGEGPAAPVSLAQLPRPPRPQTSPGPSRRGKAGAPAAAALVGSSTDARADNAIREHLDRRVGAVR